MAYENAWGGITFLVHELQKEHLTNTFNLFYK